MRRAIVLAGLTLAACGNSGLTRSSRICLAGQSISCTGPGGCAGSQQCNADGTAFDACACAGSSGSSGSSSTTSSSGATSSSGGSSSSGTTSSGGSGSSSTSGTSGNSGSSGSGSTSTSSTSTSGSTGAACTTFTTAYVAAGAGVAGIAVGDVVGSGQPDLVTADSDSQANTVSVLAGLADGGFGPRVAFDAGFAPYRVQLADLDEDGRPDLVVQDEFTLSWMQSHGDGGFGAPAVIYDVPVHDHALGTSTVGKLVGSAHLDVVAVDGNEVLVFAGAGNGSFSALPAITLSAPNALRIADLDEDGKPDLVVGESAGVYLLAGTGSTTLGTPQQISSARVLNGEGFEAVDLNGDGHRDLAMIDANASGFYTHLDVQLATGAASFTRPPVSYTFASGDQMNGLAVGNLMGRGRADLAVRGDEVALFENLGDGGFSERPGLVASHRQSGFQNIVAVDLGGAGRDDLVYSDGYDATSRQDRVGVIRWSCP